MPVKTTKLKSGKFRNTTPGGTKAKATTKANAKAQARLLIALDYGWTPPGRKARGRVRGRS